MDGISESNITGPHLTFEAPYERHNNNIGRRKQIIEKGKQIWKI